MPKDDAHDDVAAQDRYLATLACSQGGMHLLNALRYLGIDPASITSQRDAAEREWPTPWAYDVWCAWHACRIALEHAEWPYPDITVDRRTAWRSQGRYVA